MQNQFIAKAFDINGFLAQTRHKRQSLSRILFRHSPAKFKQITLIRYAGHSPYYICIYIFGNPGTGIQNGKSIAHSAVSQTGNQGCRLRFQMNLFLFRYIQQSALNILRRNSGKIITLTARQNSSGHFVYFRRSQNKDDMCRRFFHNFQQRIKRRCGKHVHLVNDIYFVGAFTGSIRCFIPQVADIVYAIVGRRVNFYHVHNAAVINPFADSTHSARISILTRKAVHCFCKNFCTSGLSRSPCASKNISMSNFIV